MDCMDPGVTWGNGKGPPSCALLGGFAIGTRVALLWQHSANARCQRVLVLALCRCGFFFFLLFRFELRTEDDE